MYGFHDHDDNTDHPTCIKAALNKNPPSLIDWHYASKEFFKLPPDEFAAVIHCQMAVGSDTDNGGVKVFVFTDGQSAEKAVYINPQHYPVSYTTDPREIEFTHIHVDGDPLESGCHAIVCKLGEEEPTLRCLRAPRTHTTRVL